MRNYTVYHLHSDRSLLDSCTNYKDYIDKAKELGMKSICFTEHGVLYNWIEKKMYCDSKGIKYLHGCEIYLTKSHNEKLRDNYHTILIAKNMEGVRELNLLIDTSTREDHTYYKNRLSYEEFLNISDNIIKISACLASPLNKEDDIEWFDRLSKHYDYYEIQYHRDRMGEQIKYNKKLYDLSKKNNIPLIVGTDTHSLNKYKAECRSILKRAKKMSYDNEDDFDLTFKSYDEVLDMFKNQNSLPIDVVIQALENTNIMADSCDDVILDPTVKYPKLSENDNELFVKRLQEMYQDKVNRGIIKDSREFRDQLNEEIRVFKKLDMCSFMLFMSEMCVWCKENDIPIGPCRGSVGGSCVAYVLDIIDMNPMYWGTVFSRFANEDRKEVGDIDLDFSPDQRVLVYKYIMDRFGMDKSAYILAIGTISDKGTIDDIGRALSEIWEENNEEMKDLNLEYKNKKNGINSSKLPLLEEDSIGRWYVRERDKINKNNPYSLNNISKIKSEYESNPEETKNKYKELFYYFDGLLGTAISQSIHPAGIIASPITLPDNYGSFWKDGARILQINMEEVHDGAGLVKYDILGLKNIQIIRDTCRLLNIEYPKSHNINWCDKEVWDNITNSPVGLFQFESKFAFDSMRKFKPTSVNDLAMLSAILRPGASSIRERFLNREFNKNPDEIIDKLFEKNNGWLIFQEDTIAFLQSICGLSGSDSDNIRRAIGRKQKDRLDKAMPDILEGYCSKSSKPRSVAEEEAKGFLDILSDSAEYQFGKNHSTGYSMITYLCAYFRHKHPLEFVTAYLNLGDEEDIINATRLANELKININPPKFRYSKGEYFPDRNTFSIYKGIGSIKYLNSTVGDELYSLKNKEYSNFTSLLFDLQNTSINSRQLDILIRLQYFSEFGKTQKLLKLVEAFNELTKRKTFKKDSLPLGLSEDVFREFSESETEKMFKDVFKIGLISYIENLIPNKEITLQGLIKAQQEYLGYISMKVPKIDKKYVLITDVNTKYTPVVGTQSLNSGVSVRCKIPKKIYQELNVGDIIYIQGMEKKFKSRKVGEDDNGKAIWEKTDETEWWIKSYSIIKDIDAILEELDGE